MIELQQDAPDSEWGDGSGLLFSFPEVHPEAKLRVSFERTLRIPDDGRDYPLPPGLSDFPLRHVDDFPKSVPGQWLEHGGVMLPMYQSEAMWLFFHSKYSKTHHAAYPFAVKVAAGKINAVTGEPWSNGLKARRQDYVVVPEQPWLDGFCVGEGIIRQFVAMPLGSGYSAEEQLTGAAEHGGLQIVVYPMKRRAFERRFPEVPRHERRDAVYCLECESAGYAMGLAPGGRMKQEIFKDPFSFYDWDQEHSSRCFVHICNSLVWRAITGAEPPTVPPTAKEYTDAGLPWFQYYADGAEALAGSTTLGALKSVSALAAKKGDAALPENETVTPAKIVEIRKGLKRNQVREGVF